MTETYAPNRTERRSTYRTDYIVAVDDLMLSWSSADKAECEAYIAARIGAGADPESFAILHRSVTVGPWDATTCNATAAAKLAKQREAAVQIDPAQVTSTYQGTDGCACGCGGSYARWEDNTSLLRKRVTRLNNALATNPTIVEVFPSAGETIYEVPTGERRVLRVYVSTSA